MDVSFFKKNNLPFTYETHELFFGLVALGGMKISPGLD